MQLFHFPKAPNARKVHIFLHEKGIDMPLVEVNVPARENLEPAYLAINPRGLVPLLELDDGTFIDESLAICRYLESLYPEPALFGKQPREKALIDCWERRMEFDGYLPGVEAYRNSAERFANYAVAGVSEGLPAIAELAARGRRRLDIFFDRLETRLSDSEFVAGDSFTMADITGVVAVDMAKRSHKQLPKAHVHARRWYQAMYARESVASTYLD